MREANPYQIIGAKYIVDNKKSLLADEMGIGKTAQAIMAKSLIEKQKGKKDVSLDSIMTVCVGIIGLGSF